jgi:hypothetical protein
MLGEIRNDLLLNGTESAAIGSSRFSHIRRSRGIDSLQHFYPRIRIGPDPAFGHMSHVVAPPECSASGY